LPGPRAHRGAVDQDKARCHGGTLASSGARSHRSPYALSVATAASRVLEGHSCGATVTNGASGHSLHANASPMTQLRRLSRPTAVVRMGPPDTDATARGGHGRRGRTLLPLGSDGHKLNRRVRPVQGDHLPRWQGPQAHGSCCGEGFDPPSSSGSGRGR
jgi:hypothetical protein